MKRSKRGRGAIETFFLLSSLSEVIGVPKDRVNKVFCFKHNSRHWIKLSIFFFPFFFLFV